MNGKVSFGFRIEQYDLDDYLIVGVTGQEEEKNKKKIVGCGMRVEAGDLVHMVIEDSSVRWTVNEEEIRNISLSKKQLTEVLHPYLVLSSPECAVRLMHFD
jgi:hypothetical protein